MPTRILVVDDHQMVREGLRLLLADEPDLQLVAEATDGQQAVAMVDELLPEVVIMDIGLPVMDGIEATHRIKEAHPEIAVIALSAHSDACFVDEMKKLGACGYVLKDMAFELLVDAIRKCTVGETSFP
ncbi:MAG: response regulator transcription factor [Armatimonadia bacterium]